MQLSLTGMTFLISSGDSGVASFGTTCLSEGGTSEVNGGPDFAPLIGNTCPYVLSVGATQVKSGVPVGLSHHSFGCPES